MPKQLRFSKNEIVKRPALTESTSLFFENSTTLGLMRRFVNTMSFFSNDFIHCIEKFFRLFRVYPMSSALNCDDIC